MSYKFFENTKCEFYPCHRYPHKNFSCMFCYCVLYNITDCGGDYSIIELETGNIKDCSNCYLPHKVENYDYIIRKLHEFNNKLN